MKKKLTMIIASIMVLISALMFTGCGSFMEKAKTTFSEQKVDFYNVTTTEDGGTITEKIDENSVIHICFPAATKNKFTSKFELKASKLLISMEYIADDKSYEEIIFAVSLVKANKDNYILLLDDDIKPAVMEAITIDTILESDKEKFSLYYSDECANEKYYTSGNAGYALKCSIDLAKLSDIARFSGLKDAEIKYTTFSFELITNGGFDSGKVNSLYVNYAYDTESGKFVEYVDPAEIIEPETPETPTDPETPEDGDGADESPAEPTDQSSVPDQSGESESITDKTGDTTGGDNDETESTSDQTTSSTEDGEKDPSDNPAVENTETPQSEAGN